MCAWRTRDRPAQEQAEYWSKIRDCMECAGPVLRHLFNEANHGMYFDLVDNGVEDIIPVAGSYYVGPDSGSLWHTRSRFQQLSKVVRVLGAGGTERFQSAPISPVFRGKVYALLGRIMKWPVGFRMVLIPNYILWPAAVEEYGALSFMYSGFVRRMHDKLYELRTPVGGRKPRLCVLHVNLQLFPTDAVALLPKLFCPAKVDVRYRVLYVPGMRNFPLVDAFFFVAAPRRTIIGLQTATAKAHHITSSAMRQFSERLAEVFNDWEAFSVGLSWEIIYVQHAECRSPDTWQRCGVNNDRHETQGEAEETEGDVWDENVHHYLLKVSVDDAIAACGTEDPVVLLGNMRLDVLDPDSSLWHSHRA
ncbi:hypothetical protein TRSC58_06890 [Trypanosoma rangeli SC58]|uniref:Retrotransposon hot spot protein,C-terminal domain-containing protein n=1 Tax=Trypanosoma rangeli SC58 TaxID=429131 RepID=A0A061IUC1_TRYRA|nr:hypothetical protein TRSC58_06890 [Trypanosoma rangeli SC58]